MVEEDGGVLINSRLLTYDLKVGLDVRNKTKWLGYDDSTTLNVVCLMPSILHPLKHTSTLFFYKLFFTKCLHSWKSRVEWLPFR